MNIFAFTCHAYEINSSLGFFFKSVQDIRHFSAIPSEEEVLFPPNSQFRVEEVLTSEQDKRNTLHAIAAYDMTDLDVYVLKQIA